MLLYHEEVDLQISDEFLEFKSSEICSTLKVPTSTRHGFFRFTTLCMATDSEEVTVCR